MKEAIKILREQMVLCSRLIELFDALGSELKNNTSGAGVTSSVQLIEPVMRNLSKNDLSMQEFLKSNDTPNMKTFVDLQPDSVEHDVANRLLIQVDTMQKRLYKQLADVYRLFSNSKAFVEFNLNVISQTAASDIYGSPGSESKHLRGRKIFDANV